MGNLVNEASYGLGHMARRTVVTLPDGTLVAAVLKNPGVSPSFVRLFKSVDKGETWTQIKEFPNSWNTHVSIVAIDYDVIVIYTKGDTNNRQIVAEKYNVLNNGNITSTIITAQSTVTFMNVYKDSVTGRIHFIWSNGLNVYYSNSVDGINWSNPETTFQKTTGVIQSGIILASNNEIYFVVAHGTSEPTQILFRERVDNEWLSKSTLINVSGFRGNVDAAISKNGVIHVAWDANDTVQYVNSNDKGSTWNTLKSFSGTSKLPHLHVSENNKISINFVDTASTVSAGNSIIVYTLESTDEGNNFYNKERTFAVMGNVNGLVTLQGNNIDTITTPVLAIGAYNNKTSISFDGNYTFVPPNKAPTISIASPTANQTLHENSTLTLAGNTTDTDIDDVVTIKYQIDSGTVRNLHSAVSNGATPIDFSKVLTYKDGVLKDGNTVLTSVLDKDTPHTISVWSEDGKGGKSNIITRTFFVVPNRAPVINVNPINAQSELINSNVINVSGMVTDADKNDVTVTFTINGGEEQQIFQGPPSAFTFNILLNDLKVGANTIIVKATDTYNTTGAKTLTINKTHNATHVNKAVALYKITAPTGSAKSILLWLSRTLGMLDITTEVSLTNDGETENFMASEKTNSVVANGLRKEEFAYKGDADKTNIVVKITYNRTDASVIDTIKQISGVLF